MAKTRRKCAPDCICGRHAPTAERGQRISAAKKGRPLTAAHRAALACAPGCQCGKHELRNAGQFKPGSAGFTGTHSDETRAKIRAKRALQVNVQGPIKTRTDADRFFDHVAMPGSCWEWTGAKDPKGYGAYGIGSSRDGSRAVVRAHRYAYELLVGPVPDGLELDHLCNNRGCVNPGHLEAVTHLVNVRRAVARRNGGGT